MSDLIEHRPLLLLASIVSICVLLGQQCAVAELNILQLKVNTEASEKVLNQGSNFTVTCEGIRPIYWETPDPRFDEISDSNSRTRTTLKERRDVRYNYCAELQFISIDVYVVGSYVCRCNSSDEIETSTQNKSVYIYVKDQARLLAPADGLLIASQYEELIVPCKPSSPDVSVTLLQDDAPIVPGKPFAGLGGRIVTYDPQIGFTIPDVQMRDSSYLYTCQGVLNSLKNTHIFILTVIAHIDFLPKPEIYNYSSCDGITVLNCEVRMFVGIPFDMRWEYPNKVNINKARVNITTWVDNSKERDPNTRVGVSTLTILNTTSEDMGLFKCEIIGPSANISSDEIFMSEDCKKIEKALSFLRDRMPCVQTVLTLIIIFLLMFIFIQCLLKNNTGKCLNTNNYAFFVGSEESEITRLTKKVDPNFVMNKQLESVVKNSKINLL